MTDIKFFNDLREAEPTLYELPQSKKFTPQPWDPEPLQFLDALSVLRSLDADRVIDFGWSSPSEFDHYLAAFDIVFSPVHSERLEVALEVDAVLQSLQHVYVQELLPNKPSENDVFPFESKAALRRRGWGWLRPVDEPSCVPGIKHVSLRSIQAPEKTVAPQDDASRSTFKSCMWTADEFTRRITPSLYAREVFLVILSGTVSIKVDNGPFDENPGFVCSASNQEVSRFRLRSSNPQTPWLPPVTVTGMSANASGILIVASDFGVPYCETDKGGVSFYPAMAANNEFARFWGVDFDAQSAGRQPFILQQIARTGPLDREIYKPLDKLGMDFPHEPAVRQRDFGLLEETIAYAPDAGMQVFLRVVNIPKVRPAKTTITRHEGAEIVVPIHGAIHTILGSVDPLQGEFRSMLVDEANEDEAWLNGECQGYDLSAKRDGCALPDVLMISSNEVSHGFCGSDQSVNARAISLGTNVFRSETQWYDRFYQGTTSKEPLEPNLVTT